MNFKAFSEMIKGRSSWMEKLLPKVCPRLSMMMIVEGDEMVDDDSNFSGKIIERHGTDVRTIESDDPVVYKDTLKN